MAKVVIVNPTPFKGRVRFPDGTARRRCRVCGRVVWGRHGGVCRECLARRNGGGAR